MGDALDQYGLIGHPVSHSWSPFIHGMFASQTHQRMSYRLYDVPADRFESQVHDFAAQGLRGLNVTVPHKMAAARVARELSPRAELARAVNTLSFTGQRILGDNTDGAGLVRDLRDNLGVTLKERRLLIAGAGGAVRGIIGPLRELEPAEIVIAGRAAERARALAAEFEQLGRIVGCGLEDLAPGGFDLVINATSASLTGEVPAIAPETARSAMLCYDMAYSKTDTAFVRWAREQGCPRAVQGWGMLVEQAAEAFQIWRGIRPETRTVLDLLPTA
ncbi:MAG TPA: shikimate dehydrogenase [Steroidobacteraceae bacterium]|nr:shikimate dehydrogenase [Steroidobacteraceae bacterium]